MEVIDVDRDKPDAVVAVDDNNPFKHDRTILCEQNCWKCLVRKNWQDWVRNSATTSLDGKTKVVWLQERPSWFPMLSDWEVQQWRCGCGPCYNFCHRANGGRNGNKNGSSKTSKWARFQVPKLVNSSQVTQHEKQKIHRMAIASHCKVDVAVQSTATNGRPKICQLKADFGPRRPKLEDWRRVLAAVRTMQTPGGFVKSSLFTDLDKHFSRALWQKMVYVMRNAVKVGDHQAILKSVDRSLSGDGKSKAESLLFHAATVFEDHFGCIALFNVSQNETWESIRDLTNATKIANGLEDALRMFATVGKSTHSQFRHEGTFNADVFAKIKEASSLHWDGASNVQKAARISAGRGVFGPRAPDVERDQMHEWVTACVGCCFREEDCQMVRHHWLTKKKSHCKQIRHSDRYCNKWVMAQEHHIKRQGHQGGDLDHVLTSAAFSAVRKLTEGGSLQVVIMSLIASAATVADEVDEPCLEAELRNAATETWKTFTPYYVTLGGMIADYLSVVGEEKGSTDGDLTNPSCYEHDIDACISKLKTMYVKGEVLGSEGKHTFTQMALDQLKEGQVFFCKGEAHVIGIVRDLEHHNCTFAKQALATMTNVVNALEIMTKDMLRSDSCVTSLMGCFNLKAWLKVHEMKRSRKTANRQDAVDEEQKLLRKHKLLCALKGWPEDSRKFLEWIDYSTSLYRGLDEAKQDMATWQRQCVIDGLAHVTSARTNEDCKVCFFKTYSKSTCRNERFLKLVANAWALRGKAVGMETLENCVVVKAYGPKPKDVQALPGEDIPTFFVTCDRLFEDLIGNRCFIVKKKRAKKVQPANAKTKKGILRLQRDAVKQIAEVARKSGRGNTLSCLGPTLRKLRPDVQADAALSDVEATLNKKQQDALTNYRKGKRIANEAFQKRLAGESNPYHAEAAAMTRKTKSKQVALATAAIEKKRLKKAETKVYIPKVLRQAHPELLVAGGLPDRFDWDPQRHFVDCDVVLCENLNVLSEQLHYVCAITSQRMITYREFIAMCWIYGKRLATLDWIESAGNAKSVKFSASYMKAQAGFFFSNAFNDAYGERIAQVMQLAFTLPGSKWTTLDGSAYKFWKGQKHLQGRAFEITSLHQLHQTLKKLSVVDRRNSDLSFARF